MCVCVWGGGGGGGGEGGNIDKNFFLCVALFLLYV